MRKIDVETTEVHAPHCQPVAQTNDAPAAARRETAKSLTPQCVQPEVTRIVSPRTTNEPFGSATT